VPTGVIDPLLLTPVTSPLTIPFNAVRRQNGQKAGIFWAGPEHGLDPDILAMYRHFD
jgi:hypothetical protein